VYNNNRGLVACTPKRKVNKFLAAVYSLQIVLTSAAVVHIFNCILQY